MIVFKCKMCGGDLHPTDHATTCECEYCGSVQTIPSADSEKKLNLFARAQRLLRACEFDKAAGVYESIVAEFPEEAEAYWGLVLCKYGIEYVDDPGTGRKVPTCHRSSFESIMDDGNYEQALENTDAAARRVFRDEAKAIEALRKGIIEVSGRETPYDIFICYKETDENGERTLDSVLAQDIYNELTGKGYRVFFSRITLEDKLGQEYEPCIFAALNSAKVMLAVGTDYEYYNAVWVKNEWSRFLKLISAGEKKVLIPCYKNIDAYDMPKEFARFQAQDMGKVGAMQDLMRGIEKIIPKAQRDGRAAAQPAQAAQPAGPTADSLLQRAYVFLEDEQWESAAAYADKVLDIDVRNARAYLVKLMAELKVRAEGELGALAQPFDGLDAYQKIMRFGDEALKAQLGHDVDSIKGRIEQKDREQARKIITGLKKTAGMISAGNAHSVGVKLDGSVISAGSGDYGKRKLDGWSDINAVAAGLSHTVGLKADGTVMARGDNSEKQCEVNEWRSITSIAAGKNHTVGLKTDGTVVATGNDALGQCSVDAWSGIQAIAAGAEFTVGLKSDGSVMAVGRNNAGQCDLESWSDIVAVAAGEFHVAGLKSDGTVITAGRNKSGQCEVSHWTDIIAIAAGSRHTVGLKSNGTVVATGWNVDGQCDVGDWSDIISIAAGYRHTIGLKSNGTVVCAGYQKVGQGDFGAWKLFKGLDTLEQDRVEARARRAKALAEEEALREKERIEAEKRRAQRIAEEEARKARERAEAEARETARRNARIASLRSEQTRLRDELATLKGLFTGRRRREIESRLSQIESELNRS